MPKIDLEKFICSILLNGCDSDWMFTFGSKITEALKDQGLEYKDGQIVEINTPFEVKAGQWYMCIKDFELEDGSRPYVRGHLYIGDARGCLNTERGTWVGYWENSGDKYFRPATEDEIPQPNFKDDDWVVCEYNNIIGKPVQYKELKSQAYKTFLSNLELTGIKPSIRLWTIQDAKDGDVLVYGDNPEEHHVTIVMLFKSWRNEYSSFNHFHIFDDEFKVNDWCDCGNNAHPATKEQRDLLFQKMTEACYEWDAEKKELKKIQKPDLDNANSSVRQRPKEELTEFEEKVKDFLGLRAPFFIQEVKEESKIFLSLARKQIAEEVDVESMVETYRKVSDLGSGFDLPIACMVRAYRQGIIDTIEKIKKEVI